MELEKGNDLPREVSRGQEDSAISKDMEMEATPPADEKKRGKRRSENGDHDHSKKRSKKKKSKKDDDEHGAADHGAPDGGGDGEGDKRKGSERSSSNHHHGHRDHHHSRHHRDKDRSDKSSSSSSASSSVEAASRKSADREGDDQRHKKRRKQDHPDANHDDGHDGDGSRHGHRRHHDAGDGADHADDKKRSKDDRSRHGSREKDERERERERGRSSSRPRDERRRADDDGDERSSSRHHRDRHHHRDRRDDGGDDDYYRRHHHQQQPRDRRDVERYEDRDHHRHTERHDDRESHRHHSRRADDASYERELREYRRRQQQQQQQQQPLDGEPSRSSARQRDEAPADSRRRGPSDYADRRDPDRRDNGGRGQDLQQQQQQQQKPKQVVDEELARMVEEELRRKESEQTEEEKAQKLIEERRRKRQAILDKYKQQQPPQQQQDKAAAAADEAASSSSTSIDAATAAPAAADENKKAEEAERLAAVAATDATTAATSTSTSTANASSTSEGEAKRTVTHFDMFNELPASLIPSDDKLGRPARAAAAAGEDELNLQDNWDDEEGYYAFRIGEMVKGRYAVHASHGKGVFSTVLIAKDTHKDDVEVAIKVIRNNDTMFRAGLKETELLEKITAADPKDKRHCIRVLDSFQYRNHLCIVLEPMSMNLREVVKKFGRDVGITMQAVRTYARQLFVALKHLKSLNVLHADLKPDNIVLNHNLTVLKLCDFGSASLMEEENAITPYLVSRFYRAPEIMLGLPYDFEIDVWAAGCCLFEMYTGRILFQGRSNNEMLRMQMEAMGPFGRKMLRRSKFWQRHFNQQTFYFQQVCIDEVSQQEYVKEVNVVKPTRDLRAELQRAASAEDESQAGQLADLVLKCLQLDPSKRISPELALAHPFLKAP